MPMLSVFLALFWLTISAGLYVVFFTGLETGHPGLDEHSGKLAALALLLFGYNVFRYRYARLQQRLRREEQMPPPRSRRVDEDRPIDPTFDFSDKPAASPPPEKPPS